VQVGASGDGIGGMLMAILGQSLGAPGQSAPAQDGAAKR